jgi:hypothetical protein
MNPFLAFCLYVAARVFVQYLKFRPKDQQMTSSLNFLLDAMHALKRKNPLTESFLVQLDVDLEGAGIDVSQRQSTYSKSAFVREYVEHVRQGHRMGGILTGGKEPPSADRTVQAEIPVNTDSVKCSPLFEIRESQNPAAQMNRFNKPPPTTQPPQGNSPGPPFHVAKPVDFDMDPAGFEYLNQSNTSYSLPARGGKSVPDPSSGTRITVIPDGLTPPSDMDKNSPVSRSNSVQNTGFSPVSHFTPPSDGGDSQHSQPQQRQQQRGGLSPMTLSSGGTSTLPTPGAVTNVDFINTLSMDPDFSNLAFQPSFMNFDDTSTFGLSGGGGWEMSGIIETGVHTGLTPGATGTGMTPESGAGGWSQMLENIQDWSIPEEQGRGF